MKELYIGQNVVLTGTINYEENCSIWHNSVLRADTAPITIGDSSNIQDLVMIHAGDGYPVNIGKNVTVGHRALLHGCTIQDSCIIGMGSIIMNGAVIENHCIVGAGSLVTQNKHFPAGSLIMGTPAKVIRPLTKEELKHIDDNANNYVAEAKIQLTSAK